MISMNLSNIAILNIKGAYYLCMNSEISNSEDLNWMQNIDLTEKNWNIFKNKNLSSHIKMRRKILPFSDSDIDYRHTIPNFLSTYV